MDATLPLEKVLVGPISEAFEQPGDGLQYKLPKDVQWLLDHDYIKEVFP